MSEYIISMSAETIEKNEDGATVRITPKLQEIVRCRDCAFFVAGITTVDTDGNVIGSGNVCDWTELWVEPDGYCAWAVRRGA